jgi:predicted dienelactone hydrolase
MGQFASTLLNRPLDQRFVLDQMGALAGSAPDLAAITDADNTALVGYSMGGYGALVLAGAGLTSAAPTMPFAPPDSLLARHTRGNASHRALHDPRLKAVVAIGPWGMNNALWDADGLGDIRTPLMVIAGSADEVSGYDAMRQITAHATGTRRHLLTYLNAGHTAGATIPAPAEAWQDSEHLDFHPFDHYADPVWDTLRMNNIAQHYMTAFCDTHLRRGSAHCAIVTSTADNTVGPDQGFAPGTGVGLRFETLAQGETGT